LKKLRNRAAAREVTGKGESQWLRGNGKKVKFRAQKNFI